LAQRPLQQLGSHVAIRHNGIEHGRIFVGTHLDQALASPGHRVQERGGQRTHLVRRGSLPEPGERAKPQHVDDADELVAGIYRPGNGDRARVQA
jgi:hypothetical protein